VGVLAVAIRKNHHYAPLREDSMTIRAKTIAATSAIDPEPNEFDDNFLNIVGNEFKFDHAKGLAEWIKNSADAYSTTAKVKDSEQYILLRFDQKNPKRDSVFECIDFVGMMKRDIDKALKVWGLPTAAKKGTNTATFGGHGNGGKFYMRQMFKTAKVITFQSGLLNVFGFDENKRYGFARGLKNIKMNLEEALEFASIGGLRIPNDVKARWKRSPKLAGFTVVRGERPDKFSGRSSVDSILERLRLHPQARRLLSHKQVIYLPYAGAWGVRLEPPNVAPKEGFEKPRRIPLPKRHEYCGEVYSFRTKLHPDGELVLRTSDIPLSRSGEMAALNAIDILGEVGCIGSYKMNELGFMRPESEFIYGECRCPMLEEPEINCVRNDREKLVDNDLTQALLHWIHHQVDKLTSEMAARRAIEKRTRDLRESALFNQLLNRWKNKFMVKLTGDLFGGSRIGDAFGGFGGGSEEKVASGNASKKSGKSKVGGNMGEGDDGGGGSGDEKRKGPVFPRVLLSDHDRDPLGPDNTEPFRCYPRQPPVYQRSEDVSHAIYWINCSRSLAEKILDTYGADHPRWREYLFQRYVDIILKQAVYELATHKPDLRPEDIDNLIDQISSRVHDAAAGDLENFLFGEALTGTAAEPSSDETIAAD
jgi:hypothetical protein